MKITPEQKEINQLKRQLASTYSQLSYAKISRDQWRKRCAAKDENGSRSAAGTIQGLRAALADLRKRHGFVKGARAKLHKARQGDLKTYQAHLDVARKERDQARATIQRQRELLNNFNRDILANKVTIGDMNIELKDLRESYDKKREHANVLAAELAKYIEAEKARAAERPKSKTHGRPPAIDSPAIWAALDTRDRQWRTAIENRVAFDVRELLRTGPTPGTPGGIYREVPDPAAGDIRTESITNLRPGLLGERDKDQLTGLLARMSKEYQRSSAESARMMKHTQRMQAKTTRGLIKGVLEKARTIRITARKPKRRKGKRT